MEGSLDIKPCSCLKKIRLLVVDAFKGHLRDKVNTPASNLNRYCDHRRKCDISVTGC